MSLGVDLLCVNSICSFNCSYCQLGAIQVRINERHLFVPTSKVCDDLQKSRWQEADIVTFSGSGEPTLALNLGDTLSCAKKITGKETLVLTNGTLLKRPKVREELSLSDRVYLKLDAATEETFQRVNRPVSGIRLGEIVESAAAFRKEYDGHFAVQMMFLYSNVREVEAFARLLNEVRPAEVQINTPTRPYPDGWYLESRGSHEGVNYPAKAIKRVSDEDLESIARRLRSLVNGVDIVSLRSRSGSGD
jgi:wyosine [tRNA(Phe)-imidazoG37] synthetase (radical SAM superfamily)